MSPDISGYISPFWRGVLKAAWAFRLGVKVTVGDGSTVGFWRDHWIGSRCLALEFLNLYTIAASPSAPVADFLLTNHGSRTWHIQYRRCLTEGLAFEHQQLLLLNAYNWTASHPRDSCWKLSQNGSFTVRSAYRALIGTSPLCPSSNLIWNISARPKLKFTCWLAFYNQLNTRDILTNRGLSTDTACVLCSNHLETTNHLFLHCELSTDLEARAPCRLFTNPSRLSARPMELLADFDHLLTTPRFLGLPFPCGSLADLA